MELNVACLEFSRETNTESPALIECHPKTPATRLYVFAHSVLRGGSRESRLAGTPSSRSCAASPGWLNLRDLSNSPVERYQGCCMFSVVELWTAVRTKNPGIQSDQTNQRTLRAEFLAHPNQDFFRFPGSITHGSPFHLHVAGSRKRAQR